MLEDYEIRTTQRVLVPSGGTINHVRAWTVEFVTGCSGEELLKVTSSAGSVFIDQDEWRVLCELIDEMIDECRPAPGKSAHHG